MKEAQVSSTARLTAIYRAYHALHDHSPIFWINLLFGQARYFDKRRDCYYACEHVHLARAVVR